MRRFDPPAIRKTSALPAMDELAAEIVSFLGEDPERLARFLDTTGLAIADLRTTSAANGFNDGLLDYLCADEGLLVAFAASRRLDPAAIERLRQFRLHSERDE